MNTKIIISLLSIAIVLYSCGGSTDKTVQLEELKKKEAEIKAQIAALEKEIGSDNKTETSNQKSKYVSIKKLSAKIFIAYIDVQGKVDAEDNIVISSEMPGTITKIHVRAGDTVKKGDVLAETDDAALRKNIDALRTNLELVNTMYEKTKNLWEQKIGTEVQFLQVKAQKEGLEKQISALNEQTKMSKIVSPINGTVDEVNIKTGSAVAPGLPAIRVINYDNLKIKADLAEGYANKVKKGDNALIYLPDASDSVVSTVSYAARSINPLNRTFGVEIMVNDKKQFHPNMVAQVKIESYMSTKPMISVSQSMVQADLDGSPFVMICENKRAIKKMVKKGREYNGMVEITDGLKEGDEVISLGYENVNDGDALIIK